MIVQYVRSGSGCVYHVNCKDAMGIGAVDVFLGPRTELLGSKTHVWE